MRERRTNRIPLVPQMMPSATMTRTSRPSRKNRSQTRSCVRKGTVLANRVIYHFVAYEVEEMV